MKRSIDIKVMAIAAAVLKLSAKTTAASACVWGSYQPKEPKSLREE